MYIELYILDNLIMNFLILRFAAVIKNIRPKIGRLWVFSALGALYSLLCIFCSWLLLLPLKIALCLIMGLALQNKSGVDFIFSALSVLLSTTVIGGISFAIAFIVSGSTSGDVLFAPPPLRVMLYTVFIAVILPSVIRRIRYKHTKSNVRLDIVHKGRQYTFFGIIDTGNMLTAPMSSLPIIILHSAVLSQYAEYPIKYSSIEAGGVLMYFKPDAVFIDGESVDALVAPTASNPDMPAIIPKSAVPSRLELIHRGEISQIDSHI